MTISDDRLDLFLNQLLCTSEPGDTMHTMVVCAAKPGAVNALGVFSDEDLHTSVFAIAPDATVDPEVFLRQTIAAAALDANKAGRVIQFAGVGIEAHRVFSELSDEVQENRLRVMQADRRLHKHPAAQEVTRMYAASADGRRWSGERILTGPEAGLTDGPNLHVGGLGPDEREPHHRLIRAMVAP